MSYTPTEWKRGDVVTSEKLNKIEQGISEAGSGGGGGILIVHDTEGTLDKTYAEIKAALVVAIVVQAAEDDTRVCYPIQFYEGDAYSVTVICQGADGGTSQNDYVADSADGYPVLD